MHLPWIDLEMDKTIRKLLHGETVERESRSLWQPCFPAESPKWHQVGSVLKLLIRRSFGVSSAEAGARNHGNREHKAVRVLTH